MRPSGFCPVDCVQGHLFFGVVFRGVCSGDYVRGRLFRGLCPDCFSRVLCPWAFVQGIVSGVFVHGIMYTYMHCIEVICCFT